MEASKLEIDRVSRNPPLQCCAVRCACHGAQVRHGRAIGVHWFRERAIEHHLDLKPCMEPYKHEPTTLPSMVNAILQHCTQDEDVTQYFARMKFVPTVGEGREK